MKILLFALILLAFMSVAATAGAEMTAAQRAAATRVRPNLVVTATSYSWREPQHHRYGHLNAEGTCLDDTQVATDWRFYPPGTVLWIEGLGFRTVTDRGSAVRGPRHIDIHFGSLAAMRAWGTRTVRIRILNKEILDRINKIKRIRKGIQTGGT